MYTHSEIDKLNDQIIDENYLFDQKLIMLNWIADLAIQHQGLYLRGFITKNQYSFLSRITKMAYSKIKKS